MSRQQPDHAGVSWKDLADAVARWEAIYGVQIAVTLTWRPNLTAGAYAEVCITEGNTVGRGVELERVREAFPTRKGAGHAGAVLWAVSCALRALEGDPWNWSAKMRREAQKEA